MAENDGFAMGYALGQDNNNGNCNNGGMWGDGGWWAIILFAMIFGWGNGGWGGGFGGNGAGLNGALTRADLCQDMNFGQLENGVRGISQGICDSTFALNNTIVNGFNGVGNAICNLGYEQAQLHNATQMAMMQGFNAAQAQAADCCCKTQTNIMQLGNQVERGFCQTNFNDQANTTAIIQNAHNDTDRVLAKLDAMEMARKDETIAALRSQLAQCGDQTTAQYIINQLTGVISPRAVPAYPAASPCGLGNWAPQVLAQGWGNGCGCGCNQGCGC